MLFFKWLLEDGEINPDSGNERFQEEDGELLDNTSQFITKTIENTKYHDFSDNIVDQPSDEEPP